MTEIGTSISQIGRQLANARRSRGWTQSDVAQRIASHVSQVSPIEQGKANPTLQTLIELSDVLGLSVALVPKSKLQAIEKLIGQPDIPAPLPTDAGNVYDDVFIPDPDVHGRS